jgi:DNA-binding XRE family transcriptional regulator
MDHETRQQSVYLLLADNGAYKIGRSFDPNVRRRDLASKMAVRISFVFSIKTHRAVWCEAWLHSHFASKRIKGEWFSLIEEDVAFIKGLTEEAIEEGFSNAKGLNGPVSSYTFAVRLLLLREQAGLSIQDLADDSGVSRQFIHKLERGEQEPSLAVALKLVRGMGLSLSAFDDLGGNHG